MSKLVRGLVLTGCFMAGLLVGVWLRGNVARVVRTEVAKPEGLEPSGQPAGQPAVQPGKVSQSVTDVVQSAPGSKSRVKEAPAGTGGSRVNPYFSLVDKLQKLPLEPGVLPRESPPPTTLRHVTGNASKMALLPEIYVPCCAKTGTTFLWGCTSVAYHPSIVCGRDDAAAWVDQKCQRRKYVLTGFRLSPNNCRATKKEFFFWGGGKGEDGMHYPSKGLLWYAGIPFPISQWTRKEWHKCFPRAEVDRMCLENLPEDVDYAAIAKRRRSPVEIVPPGGRIHPACRHVRFKMSKRGGPPEVLDQMLMESGMPWIDPQRYSGARSMDFTPNQLFDPRAALRIYDNVLDPNRLKFIVTMRNPLKRAYSEWSMFVKWNWEKVTVFGQALKREINVLRTCNASIWEDPSLVITIPHEEFSEYHARCFTGQAMEYIRNSLYIIGFRNFMRVFRAEQFLVLWLEDMKAASPTELLREVSDFTGLHLHPLAGQRPQVARECMSTGKRRVNHQSFDEGMSPREEQILQRIFTPFSDMLEVWLTHYQIKVGLKGRRYGRANTTLLQR